MPQLTLSWPPSQQVRALEARATNARRPPRQSTRARSRADRDLRDLGAISGSGAPAGRRQPLALEPGTFDAPCARRRGRRATLALGLGLG